MAYDHSAAGQGLKIVLLSVLVGICAGLLTWVPVFGVVFSIAAPAVAAYGYHIASKGHPDYTMAMYLSIVGIVISLLQRFLGEVMLIGSLLGIAATVCGALVVHIVCNATGELLDSCGRPVSPKAELVWKLYVLCALISVVLIVLSGIPLVSVLAVMLAVPTVLAMMVASIIYLVFLWQAQRALLGG